MQKNTHLTEKAAALLKPYKMPDRRLFGDVAAVVVSRRGNVYPGVCVDTTSWGLCAERSAIAAMITNGEYEIDRIVAVWRSEQTNQLHVLPPCGVCRKFMRQVDAKNLDARVILGASETQPLRDLLPRHEWPAPLA